jgi:hypothetical protein
VRAYEVKRLRHLVVHALDLLLPLLHLPQSTTAVNEQGIPPRRCNRAGRAGSIARVCVPVYACARVRAGRSVADRWASGLATALAAMHMRCAARACSRRCTSRCIISSRWRSLAWSVAS